MKNDWYKMENLKIIWVKITNAIDADAKQILGRNVDKNYVVRKHFLFCRFNLEE